MQKLCADGYALTSRLRQRVGAGMGSGIENVIYYVIKLPMQKQIPTSLQALKKHLYEIPITNSVGVQLSRGLDDELLFKTE
ncbi:hypothetical protein [Aeromonas sp. AE23HZ002T15]